MKLLGTILIVVGLSIIILIFGPVLVEEIRYQSTRWGGVQYSLRTDSNFPESGVRPIFPVDEEFGLVIPKINLNERIFSQVDANNPAEYLPVLKMGAAQAKGSAYPDDEKGNVFLFGHSTDTFYNISRYNAVFFLINKLEEGDEINVFYKRERYLYQAIEAQIVKPNKIASYLEKFKGQKIVTLQTCYPPGTTLKRLLVIGKAVD